MKYFPIVKGVMLLWLVAFYLFWFLPSMRSMNAWRNAMDRVFNESEACWQTKYRAGEYEMANRCYDKWSNWEAKNDQPHPGIDWPWAIWKEKP